MPLADLLNSVPHLPVLALQDGAEGGGSGPNMLIILLVPLAIFWFVAILPERRERKRKQAMITQLKKNDRVLTTSGMYATVAAVNENDITIKFDDGPVRVKALKSAIATVIDPEAGKAADGKEQG
jgi:preprotein translocase subunit YajC